MDELRNVGKSLLDLGKEIGNKVSIELDKAIQGIAKKKQSQPWSAYCEELEEKARKEQTGFAGHLSSFLAVNAGLFVLNFLTSPGYPWALFPLGGWGIGLISHLSNMRAINKTAKRAKRYKNLDPEAQELFKKIEKNRNDLRTHLSSNLAVIAYLILINVITSATFMWSFIPGAAILIGIISHIGRFVSKEDSLNQGFNKALEKKGGRVFGDIPDFGPWQTLVQEAEELRNTVFDQLQGLIKGKRRKKRGQNLPDSLDEAFLPLLDSYLDQVRFFALKTKEINCLLEGIHCGALEEERQTLSEKLEASSSPILVQEYQKNIAEIQRQEQTYHSLKEESELMVLRMRSSVNNLKQMNIDLARLTHIDEGERPGLTETLMREKTSELNQYLQDLRKGYEEVGL